MFCQGSLGDLTRGFGPPLPILEKAGTDSEMLARGRGEFLDLGAY